MITATELKNGTTFLVDGKPFKVVKYTHTKMGRGGATVRVSARNLETGDLTEKSFDAGNKVDEIATTKKRMQYLYNDGDKASFMDPSTYEQIDIGLDILGDSVLYMKEGSEIDVLFWDLRALSVDIAPKVVLEVTETDPGLRGNSASNVYKSAKLENGLETKVPLFIKVGDKVRIDTRTGDYVERATS
jgi:elongation factor P